MAITEKQFEYESPTSFPFASGLKHRYDPVADELDEGRVGLVASVQRAARVTDFLHYNGVTLRAIKVDEWDRSAVYDESGCDLLYIRHRLTVTAIYNPQFNSYSAVTGESNRLIRAGSRVDPDWNEGAQISAAGTDATIRGLLLQPRERLVFVQGGRVTLMSPPKPRIALDGTPAVNSAYVKDTFAAQETVTGGEAWVDRQALVDANFGPKPLSCSVVRLYGSRTWLVRFTVETCLGECPKEDGWPLVSNRFTQRHSIDDDRYTTIITSGVATFRTDLLSLGEASGAIWSNPDFYREYVIPGMPVDGFRRVSVDVQISPAGNSLYYEVIDREMQHSLAHPASLARLEEGNPYGVERFDASVTNQSMTAEGNAATNVLLSTFQGTAWGNRYSSRSDMLVFLLRLALARLDLPFEVGLGYQPAVHGVLRDYSTREQLNANVVTLQMTVQRPAFTFQAEPDGGAGGMWKHFCETIHKDKVEIPEGPNGASKWVLSDPASQPTVSRGASMPTRKGAAGTHVSLLMRQAVHDACAKYDSTTNFAQEDISNYNPAPSLRGTTKVKVQIYVPPPSGHPDYTSQSAALGGPYTKYETRTTYVAPQGGIQLPSTRGAEDEYGQPIHGQIIGLHYFVDPDPDKRQSSYVASVYSPMSEMVVSWVAERVGQPPAAPSPYAADPNKRLIHSEVTPLNPKVSTDQGAMVYCLAGTYRYALLKPRMAGDNIEMGLVPWLAMSPSERRATMFGGNSWKAGVFESPADPSMRLGGPNAAKVYT
jgi:hypothetical protein